MNENAPIIPADQRKIMHVVGGKDGAPQIVTGAEKVVAIEGKLSASQKAANDARRLMLLVARVQKAIGNHMEAHLVVGCMAHITAQVICQMPRDSHARAVQNFVNGLDHCLMQTYPPEYVAQLQAERMAQQSAMGNDVVEQMVQAMADGIEENFKASAPAESVTDNLVEGNFQEVASDVPAKD